MPLVSVIVPNYNHASFLEQRINSILSQSFQDFEIILLDDSSDDGSMELLKKFQAHPKVKTLEVNEINSGSPFQQWQKGINMASGKYIWIAESDDFSKNNFLETTIAVFENNPKVGITCSSSMCLIEGKMDYQKPLQINEESQVVTGKVIIQKYMLYENYLPNASAVVFDKSLVANTNWDLIIKTKWCGDWIYWVQLLELTSLWFIPQDLNIFRKHKNSVSANYADKAYDIKEIFPIVLKLARKNKNSFLTTCKVYIHWAKKLDLRKRNVKGKAIPVFKPLFPNLILHVLSWIYRGYIALKRKN